MYSQELLNKNSCWSAERAQRWYSRIKRPFGCNFVTSNAVNSVEMWQKDSFDEKTIRKELKLAADVNYNCVRIFLPYIVFAYEGEEFIDRIETVISIADEYKLKCIPVIFDDCGKEPEYGKQNEAVPYVHNSRWTCCPGTSADNLTEYMHLKNYVQSIIGRFKNDDRVLFWDVYNEAGNSGRGSKSIFLLEKVFEWSREMQPVQPLTAAAWGLDFIDDADVHKTDLKALELSDFISFHMYADADKTSKTIEKYLESGYPVVCTEWLARTFNSLFSNCLPVFKKYNTGSFNWGLVNGKTQTHFPWGWDLTKGEPQVWFHDILKKDGTPYSENEIQLIKQYCAEIG